MIGAPQGPPYDLVNGVIDIDSNHLGCRTLEEVLEHSSYVERETLNHASTCKAEFLIESLELQSQESGIFNTGKDRSINIICPIARGSLPTHSFAGTEVFTVKLRAKNHSSATISLRCKYNEYLASSKINSFSSGLDFESTQTKEIFWRYIRPASSLSSFNVSCALPAKASIVSLQIFLAY